MRTRETDRTKEAIAVVGGAVLLTTSSVIVVAERRVAGWETRVFRDVNDLPDAIWQIARILNAGRRLVGSLVIVAVTWLVSRNRRLTAAALLGSEVGYWGSKGVKALVPRGASRLDPAWCASPRGRERARVSVGSHGRRVCTRVRRRASPPRRRRGAGLGLLVGTLVRSILGLGGEGLPQPDRA